MGNADGVGTSARFQNPSEMACWPDGRVFVADYNNDAVRVLTNTGAPGATVSTLGAVARPYGVALDPAGNVYVSSYTEHRITRFSPVGSGTVICGIPTPGFQDGTGGRFNGPCGLSMEEGGSLLVADFDNHAVRLVERILSAAQAP
jgi:DNA-binding beta-propeller fold protein YncE